MAKKASFNEQNLNTFLNYRGYYKWGEVYRLMRGWIQDNGYDFTETEYKEKPDEFGVEIEWRANGLKKIDAQIRYQINWYLHIWDQSKAEVEKDGKKEQVDDGRIEIDFNATIEFDYANQFESEKGKKIQDFLFKHVIGPDFEVKHVDALYYELYRFKSEVETLLKMETATERSPYHG